MPRFIVTGYDHQTRQHVTKLVDAVDENEARTKSSIQVESVDSIEEESLHESSEIEVESDYDFEFDAERNDHPYQYHQLLCPRGQWHSLMDWTMLCFLVFPFALITWPFFVGRTDEEDFGPIRAVTKQRYVYELTLLFTLTFGCGSRAAIEHLNGDYNLRGLVWIKNQMKLSARWGMLHTVTRPELHLFTESTFESVAQTDKRHGQATAPVTRRAAPSPHECPPQPPPRRDLTPNDGK